MQTSSDLGALTEGITRHFSPKYGSPAGKVQDSGKVRGLLRIHASCPTHSIRHCTTSWDSLIGLELPAGLSGLCVPQVDVAVPANRHQQLVTWVGRACANLPRVTFQHRDPDQQKRIKQSPFSVCKRRNSSRNLCSPLDSVL